MADEAKTVSNASFTKDQLIESKKYEADKDALSVLLEDDKQYTFDKVDKLLKDFYHSPIVERKVK